MYHVSNIIKSWEKDNNNNIRMLVCARSCAKDLINIISINPYHIPMRQQPFPSVFDNETETQKLGHLLKYI